MFDLSIAKQSLAGVAGFEPTTYARIKIWCLEPLGNTPIDYKLG